MNSNYKKLKDGYGEGFREGYSAPLPGSTVTKSSTASSTASSNTIKYKPLCNSKNKKDCDICTLSLIGPNKGLDYGHRGPGQSIDNFPTKDRTTYQICGRYENTGLFAGGRCSKHYCTDKYIYETTDVDGLAIQEFKNIPSLAECYNKIDYVTPPLNNKEKGVVYNKQSKMCWTIGEIPNMPSDKLTVSWARDKKITKPYHNDNAILVIKK
jgi:hypothetical protein